MSVLHIHKSFVGLVVPALLFLCSYNFESVGRRIQLSTLRKKQNVPSFCRSIDTATKLEDEFCHSVNTTKLEYCNLNDVGVSGPVHLWSMIKASSSTLLEHYLQHYICKAGVSVENMAFLLHVNNDEDQQRALAVFAEHGIDVKRNNITITDHFDEDVKMNALNRHIADLPDDAWLTYPDLDEFFHFPCTSNLTQELHPPGLACIGGRMVDRLPPLDATIPFLKSNHSITSQFPVCVKMRSEGDDKIVQGDNYKNILFPVQVNNSDGKWWRARFLNPHRLVYELNGLQIDDNEYKNATIHGNRTHIHCNNVGHIDHYSWTAGQIDSALSKLALWRDNPWRAVTYNEMLSLVDRNNSTDSWSFTKNATEMIDSARICCHSKVDYD